MIKQFYDNEYLTSIDDDNIEQVGDNQYIVINYNEDTLFLTGTCDTVINNKHVIIDTIIKNDTLIIEKTIYDQEFKTIETLINRPDFGRNVISILILFFVICSIIRKRRRKNG